MIKLQYVNTPKTLKWKNNLRLREKITIKGFAHIIIEPKVKLDYDGLLKHEKWTQLDELKDDAKKLFYSMTDVERENCKQWRSARREANSFDKLNKKLTK